jgi:hypothetical protein
MDIHLNPAQERVPEVLGFLAIRAFAGSRMAETERLGMERRGLGGFIHVGAKEIKSARRRLVKMGRTGVAGSMFLYAPSGMSTTSGTTLPPTALKPPTVGQGDRRGVHGG